MLQVQQIVKSFGEVKAIDDLSFSIEKGEIVGLLGPNGAGKSTTMRIIAGFLASDEGDVLVDEVSVNKDPVYVKSQIGYLPENNPLYKDMLVEDLLSYSAKLKNMSKNDYEEGLKFVLKSVEIKNVLYRPIKELSKGYKQRVGIAAALLHRPKILILDEPTEGLDPKQRVEIRNLIKELSKEHTIIISTHVMQEVESVCSRVVIINKGKKVADGSVRELANNIEARRTLVAELEGVNIEKTLKEFHLENIKTVEEIGDKRFLVTFAYDVTNPIQPQLSKMAHAHKWVIWKMLEETHQMEEIFKELTK